MTNTTTTTITNTENNESFMTRLLHTIAPQFIMPNKLQVKSQFTMHNLFQNINIQQQAKDSYGNLHPNYKLPIEKGYDKIKDYIQLYSNDIFNTVREIDFLCIKTAHRKIQNYQKCKQQMDNKVHRQVIVPLINASTLLFKVSNQCLLKGNSVDVCSNIITDHAFFTFRLAAQKIKVMTGPLTALIPDDVKAAQFGPLPINNRIENQVQN